MLQAIRYNEGNLEILDQLQLPFVEKYIPIRSTEDGWHAIKEMKVRGAPAIAIVAMLALSSELYALRAANTLPGTPEEVRTLIVSKLDYLVTSRPTAVNLSDAAHKLEALVTNQTKETEATGLGIVATFIQAAEHMLEKDLDDNQRIGHHGAEWILAHATQTSTVAVLTHCNTG